MTCIQRPPLFRDHLDLFRDHFLVRDHPLFSGPYMVVIERSHCTCLLQVWVVVIERSHCTCLLQVWVVVIERSHCTCLLQVWEPRTQRLVCDFSEHQYGVQCCCLSPDNKWVLSADIDSVIIVSVHTVYFRFRG